MKSNFAIRCLVSVSGIVFLVTAVNAVEIKDREIKEKLAWIESEVKRILASRCSIQVQGMATYVQTIWWPHIQYLMRRIPTEEQNEVNKSYARLQFMLGIRKCESTDETFYNGRCSQIGTGNRNPCPKNQQLYDKTDNTGYCYCQQGTPGQQNSFVYMNGQCYKQNEQGPCGNNQWLTVKNETPRCEKVPSGCPADGNHVYWSCNDGQTQCQRRRNHANTVSRCSRLGSTQPTCGAGAKLYRSGSKSYCGKPRVDWTEPNVAVVLPARGQTCPLQPMAAPVEPIEPAAEPVVDPSNSDPLIDNIYDYYEMEIPNNDVGELLPEIEMPIMRPNRRRNSGRNYRKCPAGFYRGANGKCRRIPPIYLN